ncbi:glutamate transporter [Gammaproteobacteria bacterium]|nr:glutamate transporter [Gammaproteobacteria bacterium]
MIPYVIHFELYTSLIIACLVLLIGHFFIAKSKLLRHYSIPEPVVGGLLIAVLVLIARQFNLNISFDNSFQNPLMLAFFGTLGLSADLSTLRAGGKTLVLFLAAIVGLLILQNTLGIVLAKAFNLDGVMGVILGSITLSGGHGTATGWSDPLILEHGIKAAKELGIAGATFGLILGCLIGGPVGRYLISTVKNLPKEIAQKLNENENELDKVQEDENAPVMMYETIEKISRITPLNFIQTLLLLVISMYIGNLVTPYLKIYMGSYGTFTIPTFVSVLFTAVILNNTLSFTKLYKMHARSVATIGNVSLILFLSFALMTLKLWELANLAIPMIVILIAQALLMASYAILVTFRVMGSDYNAAVMAAGHCGFGMGATPTAIVNMQAITQRFGPSKIAFLIVPMVGAFFVDLINALLIPIFIMFAA